MISRFEIQPFIATLAAMFLARGLCLVITDRSIAIDDGFFQMDEPGPHQPLGAGDRQSAGPGAGHRRLHHAVGRDRMAVLVVAFVVLHYSRFGRTVYAVGGNEPSAG